MHFEPRLNHSFRGETQVLANRYRILMPIGEGGMGSVYQAYDLCLGRVVAIKQLHVQFEGDPVGQRRFFREAETAAAMSHHNIVEIYDLGWTDDHRMF
ncbi:MAG: protein kinase domain-containing protein, partial [Nannocystaceae bacterium]